MLFLNFPPNSGTVIFMAKPAYCPSSNSKHSLSFPIDNCVNCKCACWDTLGFLPIPSIDPPAFIYGVYRPPVLSLTLKTWLFLIISFLIWYLLGFTPRLSKSQTLIFFLWISQEFFLMYFISVRRAVKGFLGRCCVCRGWLADQHAVTWWGWNAQARDCTQLTWGSYRVINSHFLSLPTCHTKQPILNK